MGYCLFNDIRGKTEPKYCMLLWLVVCVCAKVRLESDYGGDESQTDSHKTLYHEMNYPYTLLLPSQK